MLKSLLRNAVAVSVATLAPATFAASYDCQLIWNQHVYNTATMNEHDELELKSPLIRLPDTNTMDVKFVDLVDSQGKAIERAAIYTLGADRKSKQPRLGANPMFVVNGIQQGFPLMFNEGEESASHSESYSYDLPDAASPTSHSNWVQIVKVTLNCNQAK